MRETAKTNGTYTADDAARALLRAMRAAAEPPTLLLTAGDTARALAVSAKTLWSNTAPRGACIPSIRVGERSIRYSVAALQRWIEQQQTAATEMQSPHTPRQRANVDNDQFGNGARLASATGYSPDRAGSDSPALQSQAKTPGGGSTGRGCDRLLN